MSATTRHSPVQLDRLSIRPLVDLLRAAGHEVITALLTRREPDIPALFSDIEPELLLTIPHTDPVDYRTFIQQIEQELDMRFGQRDEPRQIPEVAGLKDRWQQNVLLQLRDRLGMNPDGRIPQDIWQILGLVAWRDTIYQQAQAGQLIDYLRQRALFTPDSLPLMTLQPQTHWLLVFLAIHRTRHQIRQRFSRWQTMRRSMQAVPALIRVQQMVLRRLAGMGIWKQRWQNLETTIQARYQSIADERTAEKKHLMYLRRVDRMLVHLERAGYRALRMSGQAAYCDQWLLIEALAQWPQTVPPELASAIAHLPLYRETRLATPDRPTTQTLSASNWSAEMPDWFRHWFVHWRDHSLPDKYPAGILNKQATER